MRKKACLRAALVAGLICIMTTPASAIYLQPDLAKVPIDRLVKNIEEAIKESPKNIQLKINLARVYAMAYARKTDTAEVQNGKEKVGAWFGFEPLFMPVGPVQNTDDPKKREAAKEALKKSIAWYKKVVAEAPENLVGRIGLGWVLAEAGEKEDAIKELRFVIEEGWKKEKDLKALGLGGHTYTAEAGSYLIPLLDAKKDADEIATVQERIKKLKSLPRPITPVVIPLQDGLKVSDIEDPTASVAFDADGRGLNKRWSWIRPNAGWLVYDPSGKGEIRSGLQLFGNVTFWLFWSNGYEAMTSLDDNADGQLTGKELQHLAIWCDANRNGIADAGEVKPLSAHAIIALSCRWQSDASHPQRFPFAPEGVTFRDGSMRPTFDVILQSK